MKLPYEPVCPSIGQLYGQVGDLLVGMSKFTKGQELSLPMLLLDLLNFNVTLMV